MPLLDISDTVSQCIEGNDSCIILEDKWLKQYSIWNN